MTPQEVLAFYAPTGAGSPLCCWCLAQYANAVHEIEPKSKRPKDWDTLENRVPICTICHDLIHSTIGTANAVYKLTQNRAILLAIAKRN